MQVTSILKAGVVAAVIGFAGAASAVPLNGTVSVGGTGLPDTGPLNTPRLVFSPGQSGIFGISTGNFGGFTPSGSSLTISAFDVSTATGGLTLSGSFGSFTSTSVFRMPPQASNPTDNQAEFFFLGTLVSATQGDTTNGYQVPTGNPNASFRATLTRNGVGNNISVAFAGVLAAPPVSVPVPEPASMALLGMGLLGMGLARRKKAN